MEWETVIGIEVHVQLKTITKIFSGAPTAYGAEPNTQACEVDIALPGVLPVLNQKAVEYAVKFGLSIDAAINKRSVFARKNYFYPDLPKGYQISQHEEPIVGEGHLDVQVDADTVKRIGITRAHLEEDAGKSLHGDLPGYSGIDVNRAGTPLLEIVSEPDMRSAQEAVAYLKTLHSLVCYLDICDGNMQEGSFRCDVNISLRPKGSDTLGTRAEVKNVNSFRFVEHAINYEVDRQKHLLESGGEVVQETRLYDADKDQTRSMRSKENAHDYRYFPEPDLLPCILEDRLIDTLRADLPELPWEKRARFEKDYGLNSYDAALIANTRAMADYFESAIQAAKEVPPKLMANWIASDLSMFLNKEHLDITDAKVSPQQLAALVTRIHDETISNSIGKTVFEAIWQGDGSADEIIEAKGLKQITDSSAIEAMIDEVIANSPNQLEQYRAGKDKLFGYFVGQVMKATQGKANPKQLNELLKKKLA